MISGFLMLLNLAVRRGNALKALQKNVLITGCAI